MYTRKDPVSTALFNEDEIVLVTSSIKDATDKIYPEELECVKNTASKRIHEFSTGRLCAKKALNQVGIKDYPVLVGNDREPIWPDNIVGSITHCKDIVGVAVAKNEAICGIGLDIERIKKLRYDISRHVCTNAEKAWLTKFSNSTEKNDLIVTLLFSIKESVYKAFYHYKGIKLGFQDCTITPELSGNKALIQFHNNYEVYENSVTISLRFYIGQEHIYSSTVIKKLVN